MKQDTMKKYALNDITLMQYIFLISGAQVGIGLMTLPRELAMYAGMDGWISLILGWVLAVAASVMIIQVMKKHPDDTLFDLLPRYFGKVIGFVLRLFVIFYHLFAFCAAFLSSVFLFKLELLPKTPNYMVILLFSIPVYVIARNQIRILGRFAELSSIFGIWLLLLYLYPLKYSVWLNLLPVLREGWTPVLVAVKTTGLSFLGFETAFVLYPFLKRKEFAVTGIVLGNTVTLVIYLFVTIVCFVYYSPDGITSYIYPTLKTLKVIEFRFLERIEIIILVAYVFIVSRVWIFYLYGGLFGISHMLGKQDHRPYLRIFLLAFFLSSFFFIPDYEQLNKILKWFGQMGIYYAFAFPFFFWIYTSLIDRFRKEK